MNRLSKHMTVANILSCIALFVALSGAAVAAKATLAKNQVKAKNVAKEAITSPKLKKGSVTASKLANGSVVTAKIANASVNASKLKNGAVTSKKIPKDAVVANKIGPEAVTTGKLGNEAVTNAKIAGSVWSQLIKNVTYVTETSVNDSETSKSVTATCPVGKQAIGGGVRINSPATVDVVPSESAPVVSATNTRVGWIGGGREFAAEAGNWQVVAYAVCAEL